MAAPIYNKTIKSLIVAFASLFDNIEYYNDDPVPKLIKVPLVYSPREKWFTKLKEKMELDEDGKSFEIKMVYPRMGFAMISMNLAPERFTNPQNKLANDALTEFSLNKIPYDFQFELYITVKKFDDGLKIIEQIIPFFTPEYSITLTDNQLGLKNNIPIILNSSAFSIDYESDFSTTREINWTLSFTAKSFIYPPIITVGSQVPINGTICTTITSYPGNITFHGTAISNPLCTGNKNVNMDFSFSGYLTNTFSIFTGSISITRDDNSIFNFPLIVEINIKNRILYGEARGYSNDSTHTIRSISFNFIFDLSQNLSTETCVNINNGFVSCRADSKFKVIKKTIIDISGDNIDNKFERLINQVIPIFANKDDTYSILESIQEL